MKTNIFVTIALAASVITSVQKTNAQQKTIKASYNYASLADMLQQTLVSKFSSTNHKYFKNKDGDDGLYYWPNAHALNVLTDAYVRTKDKAYLIKMKTLLNGIKAANGNTFSNDFYDDMAWLAIASLGAYQATHDTEYLTVARQLYWEIKTGSNAAMGGGVAWSKGQPSYKNMPSTGNLCILAARFYQLEADPSSLALAKNLFN